MIIKVFLGASVSLWLILSHVLRLSASQAAEPLWGVTLREL
jgi:hypothetical protein